jgi:hypothetical protein
MWHVEAIMDHVLCKLLQVQQQLTVYPSLCPSFNSNEDLTVATPFLVGWSTGDEEPLVDAWVDRGRGLVLTLRDVEAARVDAVR